MSRRRSSPVLRLSRLAFAAAMAAALPGAALASGGGGQTGNLCPWAKDLHLDLGGHPLTIPQTVFEGKASQVNIDGYDILPDINKLKVIIVGPYSDMWEAALTLLDGGKRCTTYYIGEPFLINSPTKRATETQVPAPKRR